MLTQEQLKECLHYDPETGVFTRVGPKTHNAAGGYVNAVGYVVISVLGRQHLAHRLAVLYMTGAWPQNQVDHRNTIRHDNRWGNLRPCTPQINQQNLRTAQRNNRQGLLGVTENHNIRGSKKFVAQLMRDGKRIHCSYHRTPEEAHIAYLKAKRELHEGNTL